MLKSITNNLWRRFWYLLQDVSHKGFFHLLSANFIVGFFGFGTQLLVAKFLSPKELGQIKTMQSFIGVGTILAGFGFNTAVLKLCSEKRPLSEKSFIFTKNLHYTLIPVLTTLLIFLTLAKLKLFSPDQTINKWILLYMLSIPALTYTSLIMVYLQALKKIQLMAKMQVFIRLISFVFLVLITYFYGLPGYIISTVFIGYVALLPLLSLVKKDLFQKEKVKNVFSQSFFFAKWSLLTNAFGTVEAYLDIFLLNYLIKDRVAFGYYSLATTFILGMNYITYTVQSIATPYFSEKSRDKKEFIRILKKYQKLMVLIAFLTAVVFSILVPLFIKTVYGKNYALAGTYFRILSIKYFFWGCYALLIVAILGLGKMMYNFLSVAIGVLVSAILSYFFITRYGIVGAATGQVLGYLFTLVVVSFMVKHVIKIHFRDSQQ